MSKSEGSTAELMWNTIMGGIHSTINYKFKSEKEENAVCDQRKDFRSKLEGHHSVNK